MEQLCVGIDVSSTKHAAYLMKPDRGRFSGLPMQVVIGMEDTSVYGDNPLSLKLLPFYHSLYLV